MHITDFQDKHKGRLAFVLGAGPSLHYEKLENIGVYVTFAVNTAIIKYKAADYFVSHDIGISDWDYFGRLLPRTKGVKLLASDSLKHFSDKFQPEEVCFYDKKFRYDLKKHEPIIDGLVMSEDASKPIIDATASTMTAVHLAHVMGCNPIVLLGCDCCYLQDKNYFWQYPGEAKPQRTRGITVPTRRHLVKGKTLDDNNRESLECWQAIGRCNPYINVITTSFQGMLDCFPKMTYADVLSRYGGLIK